jgi:hypothetical protein
MKRLSTVSLLRRSSFEHYQYSFDQVYDKAEHQPDPFPFMLGVLFVGISSFPILYPNPAY